LVGEKALLEAAAMATATEWELVLLALTASLRLESVPVRTSESEKQA
jgi:hypothetical protein